MAFRVGDLSLRQVKDGKVVFGMTFEFSHDDYVERKTDILTINSLDKVDATMRDLYVRRRSDYASWLLRVTSTVEGHKLEQASIIIADWWIQKQDGDFLVSHPICGSFLMEDFIDIRSLVRAILDFTLPPPWNVEWKEQDGQVGIRFSAVPGAEAYVIYDGDQALPQAPDAETWVVLGDLSQFVGHGIRVCAIKDGQPGVPSQAVLIGDI